MSRFAPTVIFLLVCLISSCTSGGTGNLFSCIIIEVDNIEAKPKCEERAKVWRWEIDGKLHFFIENDCAANNHYLYDEYCNVVCQSGWEKSPCLDAYRDRVTAISLVWEDLR